MPDLVNHVRMVERRRSRRPAIQPAAERPENRATAPRPGSTLFLQRILGNDCMGALDKPVLQRMRVCGGHCSRRMHEQHEAFGIQPKLEVGAPDDRYEREADRVAEDIVRMPLTRSTVQRTTATPFVRGAFDRTDGVQTEGPGLPAGGAQLLSAETRAFMEPRFGADFGGVRLHRNAAAEETAERLGADAFTYGRDIGLARGAAEDDRQLMAHELTHVLQQRGTVSASSVPGGARVQRRWARAGTECAGQPSEKWIERVVVQQEEPQTVTVHWSDGTEESGPCSAGKGHCCVDPDHPEGVACTAEGSRANGSNCTPITSRNGYLVKHRDLDHNGVLWWTEFVPSRGIALHEYRPVDGTPLSHGCVRLEHDMAVKIFCGVRQNRTWVQVQGFARPMCDHAALRQEWQGDFDWGGQDLSAHDGDADAQRSIRETRRMLNAAFGRELTAEEIRALGPEDIPRCTQSEARPAGGETESESQ